MWVIGIEPKLSSRDDGTKQTGYSIYVLHPLEEGEGFGSSCIFISDELMADFPELPKIGDFMIRDDCHPYFRFSRSLLEYLPF